MVMRICTITINVGFWGGGCRLLFCLYLIVFTVKECHQRHLKSPKLQHFFPLTLASGL